MPEFALGSLFTGDLVRLGATKPEDTEALARWSNDAEYLRQLNFDAAIPRSADYFTNRNKDRKEEPGEYVFALRALADDKIIGMGGLHANWNHQSTWLWIGIGEPDYRGKGFGTDTMRLLVGYAFRELGLYRVGLGVFSYNTRAIRCYEKVGFTREGVQRAALYREGQRHDVIGMGLLRPEWEAQQAERAAQSAQAAQPVGELVGAR